LFLFIFNVFNSTLSFVNNVFFLFPFLYFPISIVLIPIPCFLFHVPFPSRVHFEPHTLLLTGLIFYFFSTSRKEKTSKKEKKENIRPVWQEIFRSRRPPSHQMCVLGALLMLKRVPGELCEYVSPDIRRMHWVCARGDSYNVDKANPGLVK